MTRKVPQIRTLNDIDPKLLLHREQHLWDWKGDTPIYVERRSKKGMPTPDKLIGFERHWICSCGSSKTWTIDVPSFEVTKRVTTTPREYRTVGIGRTSKTDARRVYFQSHGFDNSAKSRGTE